MFEAIIIAVAEGLTLECGKSILARVRMFIKKCRIKKALVKKINSDILSKCASAAYYNALDKFLSEEDFANKIVKYSFEPSSMPISTLREYIKYLAEKFIQDKIGCRCYTQRDPRGFTVRLYLDDFHTSFDGETTGMDW